ncbi:hypothetical protein J1614_012274 [Plenodomus biglobosus]|nr:hypothetical protein J1614_012274 [Plenodomus biglobosus]
MTIGVLLEDEQHSFMHDLESFFWVLFWICTHYDGQKAKANTRFERWNFIEADELGELKKGLVVNERDFGNNGVLASHAIIPTVDPLYLDMKNVLQDAQQVLKNQKDSAASVFY